MTTTPAARRFAQLAALATVLGLIASSQHFLAMRMVDRPDYHTVSHALKSSLPTWYLWAAFVPLVSWFVKRVSFQRDRWFGPLLLHLGFAISATIAHALLGELIDRVIGFPTSMHHPLRQTAGLIVGSLLRGFPWSLANYAAVAGAILAYHFYQQYREREVAAATLARQLAEARLASLRHQLSPHFLFNAMNTIAMLIRMDRGPDAVRTVAGLSDLLRSMLVDDDRNEVSLEAELALVRQYLEIEQIRFADRLRFSIEASTAALRTSVPRLILQPIVENAIRHGVGRVAAGGEVTVTAAIAKSLLRIEVRDNGPGPTAAESPGTGVGIRNVTDRLVARYGGAATFALEHGAGRGTVATITIPIGR